MLGLTECDDVRRQGFEEMHGVALLQDRRFARCVKCVLSELADRLEQAIARRSASHLRDDQRLGDKRVQRVEHGVAFKRWSVAHVFGSRQCEPAGEHAQTVQQHALGRCQQLIRPLDRAAHRLMTLSAPAASAEEA